MKRSTLIWLITAVSLLLAGGIIFTCSLVMVGFDFLSLDNRKYVTETIEITDSFTDITVDTAITDIRILPSDDGKCRAVCYGDDKTLHSAYVKESRLYVETKSTYKWYDHIMPKFKTPSVTLYLPDSEYGSLSVDVNTGDVTVRTLSVNNINVKMNTGKLIMTDVSCSDLKADMSTGDIKLNSVIASGEFHLENSTGDIEFQGCDASQIYAECSTGDIEGTLLTGKDFDCKSSTGDVEIPRNSSGGKCELKCSTGDIEIDVYN